MNVILVSSRFAKARSITLRGSHLLLAAAMVCCLLLASAFAVQYALVRFQPEALSADMRAWLANVQSESKLKQQHYLREGLDTMAAQLGRMQAQLLRLDALGARLAKLGGIKPQEFNFDEPPPQGGPYLPARGEVSPEGMSRQLTELAALLNDRNDKLLALETMLMQVRLDKKMISAASPIADGWSSSNFGWRLDPFTGRNAMHEGVDFVVPEGTPIMAAASGIVVYAGYHEQYGNMLEVDHGHDIVTRYAHASKLLAKVGQVVRRGEMVARAGSTGRSTGNHMHFEVRYRGIAQNPDRLLNGAAG
jgi:murein DD-endopeptidase MepM/ murein hydrolase activator NlpD